jgi:NAD(P)-dependent dehydrogenase (short-subunit alcohol dehydrogenase family)
MSRLDGKVIMITGGGAGIGRAAAIMCARAGAKVAVADIDTAGGEETAHLASREGGQAIFVRTDVSDPENVEASVAQVVRTHGTLTALHNNAGGGTAVDNSVVDAPIEEFWRAIKLDLYGTFLCSRFAIPAMRKAGGGSIINMTSAAGLTGIRSIACYSSAKGGVVALTRSIAADGGPFNIRCNAIAPGMVLTERAKRLAGLKDVAKEAAGKQALGAGQPDDIAGMVVYLASDESRFVTGAILPMDGGFTSLRV